MSAPIQIVDASTDDAPGIAEAHVRGWQTGYRGILADRVLDSLSVEDKTEVWYRQLNGDLPFEELMYVAKSENRVAGWITGGPTRDRELSTADYDEIFAIYVHPDFWGSGVSGNLMQTMLETLSRSGKPYVHLWCFRENYRAQRFYRKFGFVSDGRQKPYCYRNSAAPQICMVRKAATL